MLTIKELYDQVVKEISDIEKQMEFLKGERDALSGIRIDLFEMLGNKEQEDAKDTN